MPHGKLFPAQADALKPFIEGKDVHDFGCGDLELSHQLLDLGASQIVAVDRHSPSREILKAASPKIRFIPKYFHDFREPVETLFLSWPVNWYDYALGEYIEKAKMVIYLGTNVDGTACGYPDMWDYLRTRRVLAHVPHPGNTLLVYSSEYIRRPMVGEEWAALNQDRIYSFEEAQERASGVAFGNAEAHQRTG